MKSAPQMLQLLREIDDLVSFAAGSSCSASQDLFLDWCQCQSASTVPALHHRQSPWASALLSQDHWLWGSLQKGSSPGLGQQPFEPLTLKVPSPILWLWPGDQGCSALEWCAGCHAPHPEPQEIPSSALTPPISWALPKPGTAHWLHFPKLRCISSVLEPWLFHCSYSLVSAEDILDKVCRVPSDVAMPSWLWCGSWFLWGRARQTRIWKCFSRTS